MSPTPNTEVQRQSRARKKKAGLAPVQLWAHPQDHAAIKRYGQRLARRRENNPQ